MNRNEGKRKDTIINNDINATCEIKLNAMFSFNLI